MSKPRALSVEEHQKYQSIECKECGSPIGEPCISLKQPRLRKIVRHYHISRALHVNLKIAR